MEKRILTADGLRKLQEEFEDLKVNKRKEIAQKIKEAREQGDLSENAEYDAAKDEQRDIEARIAELDEILKNAEAAEEKKDTKKISVGSKVTLLDKEFDEEVVYSLVGSTEANSLSGLISNESPLGKALIGHKKGDEIVVEAPNGSIEYKVLKVEKA